MKVLVVTNMAPFVWGGAELLAAHLCTNLRIHGHESEILRVPFQWEPSERIPSQMLLARWLELANVDHVIALKFPAYLIRHESKTLWVLHQYRQAYDMSAAGMTNLSSDADGERLRAAIGRGDATAFAEARRIFVISAVVRDRMLQFSGQDSEVLRPPVNDPELFAGRESEGYVFVGGRINAMKRQHMVVEALAQTPSHVRLVVAGPPDSPDDERRLRELVERLDLRDRVHLDVGLLPRERYANYVCGAAAVAYVPFDEDSLGYVTVEAATAGRALITTTDSGGVLGLVRDGETGWVTDPHPAALAGALASACTEGAEVAALGAAARELWLGMDVTWERTIERLLE